MIKNSTIARFTSHRIKYVFCLKVPQLTQTNVGKDVLIVVQTLVVVVVIIPAQNLVVELPAFMINRPVPHVVTSGTDGLGRHLNAR